MAYDARQIANWFIQRAAADGKTLSIMSLLKLTYIAHGWHLEMRKKPLISNAIQAWQYGPVIPEVYNAFRQKGVDVNSQLAGYAPFVTAEDDDLLQQIWNIYGGMSAFRLSDITHEQGGPWQIATSTGGAYAPITNDLIQKHYEMKRLQSVQQNA